MNEPLGLGLLVDVRESQELGEGRALEKARDCPLGPEGWLLQKMRGTPLSG